MVISSQHEKKLVNLKQNGQVIIYLLKLLITIYQHLIFIF